MQKEIILSDCFVEISLLLLFSRCVLASGVAFWASISFLEDEMHMDAEDEARRRLDSLL